MIKICFSLVIKIFQLMGILSSYKMERKGRYLNQDILDNDGKFLTFKSFQDKFKIKCNFLSYLQVISAVPKHLLHVHKAKSRKARKPYS